MFDFDQTVFKFHFGLIRVNDAHKSTNGICGRHSMTVSPTTLRTGVGSMTVRLTVQSFSCERRTTRSISGVV